MAMTEPAPQRLARRAYELGRARLALQCLWLVGPMVAFSVVVGDRPADSLVWGGALAAVSLGFLWHGRAAGRGTWPGLVAGLAPLLVPLLSRASGHCCIGGRCWEVCMVACLTGGALAGGAVAWHALYRGVRDWAQLATAGLVACLCGTLGCCMVGMAGVAAMAGAIALVSAPAVLLVRARA